MPAGKIDTVGIPADYIDSCKIVLSIPEGDLVGDSLVPMGLEIYALNKQLPSPIYSDFDPTEYYDPADKLASYIYTGSNMNAPDSLKGFGYVFLFIDMPTQIGRILYQEYLDNPETYLSPQAFAKIFPGIYVKNSFGSGRVVKVEQTMMRLHYHIDSISPTTGNDTIYRYTGNYYATTPEIVTNNNIAYEMSPALKSQIAQGRNIISAPAGTDIKLTFPARKMVDSFRSASLGKLAIVNTLTMTLSASEIENDYGIKAPDNVLLVLASEKEKFFADNQLSDNKTSFMGTYNRDTKTYSFGNMREYLLYLLEKESLTEADFEFCLTPVTPITTVEESSSYYYYYYSPAQTHTIGISPYVEQPAMAEVNIDKTKIILTYSLQSTKK